LQVALGYICLFIMTTYGILRVFPYQWTSWFSLVGLFFLLVGVHIMFFQQVHAVYKRYVTPFPTRFNTIYNAI